MGADRFDVIDQAEDVAIRERQRLGLGDQPIYNLRSTLEADVGLRIFYWGLPPAIAGMYAFVADLGCCILINRKHPPERRRASMLHEIVNTTNDFQVADLCRLSNFYFVSVEAMTLRLEGLGLIPKGCWSHIKESRFEVRKAPAMLELPSHRETKDAFPERYKFLAVHAYEQEKISEGCGRRTRTPRMTTYLLCCRTSKRSPVSFPTRPCRCTGGGWMRLGGRSNRVHAAARPGWPSQQGRWLVECAENLSI